MCICRRREALDAISYTRKQIALKEGYRFAHLLRLLRGRGRKAQVAIRERGSFSQGCEDNMIDCAVGIGTIVSNGRSFDHIV